MGHLEDWKKVQAARQAGEQLAAQIRGEGSEALRAYLKSRIPSWSKVYADFAASEEVRFMRQHLQTYRIDLDRLNGEAYAKLQNPNHRIEFPAGVMPLFDNGTFYYSFSRFGLTEFYPNDSFWGGNRLLVRETTPMTFVSQRASWVGEALPMLKTPEERVAWDRLPVVKNLSEWKEIIFPIKDAQMDCRELILEWFGRQFMQHKRS